jgi:hypothetical protein
MNEGCQSCGQKLPKDDDFFYEDAGASENGFFQLNKSEEMESPCKIMESVAP